VGPAADPGGVGLGPPAGLRSLRRRARRGPREAAATIPVSCGVLLPVAGVAAAARTTGAVFISCQGVLLNKTKPLGGQKIRQF